MRNSFGKLCATSLAVALLSVVGEGEVVFDDGGEHEFSVRREPTDIRVENGTQLRLTDGPGDPVQVIADASHIVDQRSTINGVVDLRKGATYRLTPPSFAQIMDRLTFQLSDVDLDFESNRFGVESDVEIIATSPSTVNFGGGQFSHGFASASLIVDGPVTFEVGTDALLRDVSLVPRGTARGIVTGATVSNLILHEESHVTISDSKLIEPDFDDNHRDGYVELYGNSTLDISRVEFVRTKDCCQALFRTFDQSRLTTRDSQMNNAFWTGGDAIGFQSIGESRLELIDNAMELSNANGAILFQAADSAVVDVMRGNYSAVGIPSRLPPAVTAVADASDDARIMLNGGSFSISAFLDVNLGEEEVWLPWSPHLALAEDRSTIEIVAGDFELIRNISQDDDSPIDLNAIGPDHLFADDEATIVVYGSDFNFPLGEIDPLQGRLTGKLTDGNEIAWNFRRAEGARIVLIPEPSSVLLACFGLLALSISRTYPR